MRSRVWVYVSVALMLATLSLVLFWPSPIQTTPVGEALANWVANLLKSDELNRDQTLFYVEVWMNFLIFIPLAFTMFFALKRGFLTFAICLGFSILAELVQKEFLTQRVATVQDVLLNGSGALVGVTLAALISRLGSKRRASQLS